MIVNNTSKFFKCLIIFLMYNIIIILKVLCNDYYDKIDKYNKFVPDYDIIKEKEKDFSSYYFRNSKYAGQLKVRPKTFFKSLYNCDYLVLPELKDSNNNYTAYKNTILTKISSFMSELSNYGKIYKNLKDDEINLVAKYEESYEAAKNAHIKIKEYEDHSSDENKISKEIAIMNYLSNQMSEIPDIKYNDYYEHNGHTNHMFKNYEIYADATDEIYYYSNIWKEKYHTVKTCDTFLTEDEYDNILFLYRTLEILINEKVLFSTMIVDIISLLDGTQKMPKPSQHKIHDLDILKKLKSEFVVNNENYMSFLVRMKIMGNIAFHKDYHEYMYRTRSDYTTNRSVVMDIHTELPKGAKQLTACNPDII